MSNKSKNIIIGSIFFVFLALTIIVTSTIVSRKNDVLINSIPTNAEVYVKVNNPTLIRRLMFDVLFKSDFEKRDFKKIDIRQDDVSLPVTGIDLTQEAYFFIESWGENDVITFLFYINNQKAFGEFAKENENIVSHSEDNKACILIIPESLKEDQESIEKFEMYAKDLLKPSPDKSPARIALSQKKKNSLFQFFIKGSSESILKNISFDLILKENSLKLEGQAEKNPIYFIDDQEDWTELKNPFKDDYLQISSSRLPDTLNYYISKVLRGINISTPNIKSNQVYLYGFEVDNLGGSMAFLPDFDGVFRFEDTLKIPKQDSLTPKYLELNSDKIKVGNFDYYIRKISEKELYIGRNPEPQFIRNKAKNNFQVQGDLSTILNIEGSGIIAKVTKLLPQVQHTKQLFKKLEKFEILSEESGDENVVKINGIMQFSDEETASIEIIKYLLKF